MALELVKTRAGTILMGQSPSKDAEVIAKFRTLFPTLGPSIKSDPLNLSVKSPKGEAVALVERAPHGSNELMTPTKARIYNAGLAIEKAIAKGGAKPVTVGAAAAWLAIASSYRTLFIDNPVLLVVSGKALVQEARLALQAA